MGSILSFLGSPTPLVGDVADNGLATFINRHVLNRDLLLASSAVSLEGFHLGCEGFRKLVECALGAVLLR